MRKWNIYYERANCLRHRGRFKSIWNSRPGIEDAARGAKTSRKLPRSSGLAVYTSEIDIICYYNSIKFALFRILSTTPHNLFVYFRLTILRSFRPPCPRLKNVFIFFFKNFFFRKLKKII